MAGAPGCQHRTFIDPHMPKRESPARRLHEDFHILLILYAENSYIGKSGLLNKKKSRTKSIVRDEMNMQFINARLRYVPCGTQGRCEHTHDINRLLNIDQE